MDQHIVHANSVNVDGNEVARHRTPEDEGLTGKQLHDQRVCCLFDNI